MLDKNEQIERAKYVKSQLDTIVSYLKAGYGCSQISRLVKVPRSTISRIKSGHSYACETGIQPGDFAVDGKNLKRLEDYEVRSIRVKLAEGKSAYRIADEMDVSRTTVLRIKNGLTHNDT
jgi:uncharacterized protein YerC